MQEELKQTLENLALPILEDLGMELVDLEFKQEGHNNWGLRIFIDKPDGITLDDCVTVSREVEAVLEVEDPIKTGYRLEVSSPGLDRPLTKPEDYTRFAGKNIKLKTEEMLDPDERGHSRKTFTGVLLGLEGNLVRIEQTDKKGGVAEIPLDLVAKANLEIEI